MAASEISFSDKSPRAQANAQHQWPLFGPSFEGEARGDREPAAPMRAVEEVESRPALMALGKILLGRWTADIYLEDCLMIRSTGVDNEDCA